MSGSPYSDGYHAALLAMPVPDDASGSFLDGYFDGLVVLAGDVDEIPDDDE